MTTRRTMLSDLEIDEVSTVDRPANQHGLITFSKRHSGIGKSNHDEESLMAAGTAEIEVFDDEGAPVDPNSLEHGAVVYDAEGNEYVYAEGEDDLEDEFDEDDEDEVGKASGWLPGKATGLVERKGLEAAMRARAAVGSTTGGSSRVRDRAARAAQGASRKARSGATRAGMQYRQFAGDPARGGAVLAGTGAAAGGAGYLSGRRKVGKSLGDAVLEELSKAVTEGDRNEIISKALNEVQIAKAEAREARQELFAERDLRLERDFIAKADEYNLPVDPAEFGPVLKRLVERMDEDDLEVLDTVFKAAGDLLFQEYGHVGGGSNASVIDSVDALAGEMVAKAGGSFTTAEAMVALLEANPEAYDAYLQEGRI